MMRILGLDVGEKRIGLAISDPSGRIAFPLDQIERDDKSNQTFQQIKKFIFQYKIERLVAGLPWNMEGEEGWQAKKIRSFVNCLSAEISIPVSFADERFSTVLAEKVLKEGKVSFSKRKRVKDKLAAVIILQSYLDSQESHDD